MPATRLLCCERKLHAGMDWFICCTVYVPSDEHMLLWGTLEHVSWASKQIRCSKMSNWVGVSCNLTMLHIWHKAVSHAGRLWEMQSHVNNCTLQLLGCLHQYIPPSRRDCCICHLQILVTHPMPQSFCGFQNIMHFAAIVDVNGSCWNTKSWYLGISVYHMLLNAC